MTLPSYNEALKTYITALAQASIMLQRDRGFMPANKWCAKLIERWPQLELASDGQFTAFAELFYRNACYVPFAQTLRNENPHHAERRLVENFTDVNFLARNSRQFTFVRHGAPVHAGIRYQVVAICFSPRAEKIFARDVALHKMLLETGVNALSRDDFVVQEARLLVVLAGRRSGQIKTETLSVRATARFPASVVSLELWDANDLQYDATQSQLYTPHLPLDSLDIDTVLPPQQRRLVEREPTKLPRLSRDDPIVRRFDFCPRQIVLIQRRNLHEGGITYFLRIVDK
jgi:DNA-directed RNA polymerase subunit H (RpoH/RPB5)